MPRYYFHIHHEREIRDIDGTELPDKHRAWEEATVRAGKTLQGLDGDLRPGHEWRMNVTDEFANPLYVLLISAEKRA
jgi:hypothetical protein